MKHHHTHYDANTKGRDFIVGDLHGCLEDLLLALKKLKFNEDVDRVFSVGDLVDRGPDSVATAELIYKPWFFSVRGNHEDMMIQSVVYNNKHSHDIWISNGGHWMFKYKREQLLPLAKALEALPLVISVGEGTERFNVVHAEFVRTGGEPVADWVIDQWKFTIFEENTLLWGRDMIQWAKTLPAGTYETLQKNLSLTYVGHTPTRIPVIVAQQMYLDQGCVYNYTSANKSQDNLLTIADHQARILYRWSPIWKTLIEQSYDDVVRIEGIKLTAKEQAEKDAFI